MNTVHGTTSRPPFARTLFAFSVLLFLSAAAQAQVTYNYNPADTLGGTDSWSTSPNWTPITPISSLDTTLNFLFTGTNTAPLSNINSNDLGAPAFQLNSLILDGTGSSTPAANGTVTIQDGTLEFMDSTLAAAPVLSLNAFNGTGGTLSYNVNSAVQLDDNLTINGVGNASFTIGGVISGGFGISMNATATLVLTGANTYSGSTAIGSGATLQLGDGTSGHDGTIGNSLTIGNSGTLTYNRFGSSTYSGVISGGGVVKVIGTGTQIFIGANTYSGSTNIGSGATLQLGDGTTGHDGTIGNSLTIGNAGTLTYNRFGSSTYSGVISGVGKVSVIGTGTQILIGANTYSGSTNIGAGATLQLGDGTTGHDGTIGSSLTIGNAGTLVYNRFGSSTYAGVISGAGIVNVIGTGTQILIGANTYSGSTNIGAGATLQLGDGTTGHDGTIGSSLTIGNAGSLIYNRSGSSTYSGVISGGGIVSVSGTGTEIFTGANTYSGSTFISSGATLQLGDGAAGHDGTIGSSLNIADNGTLAYARSGSNSYSGAINGTGAVTKSGTGTQSLSGTTNGYNGTTTITGGALLAVNAGSLGSQGLSGLVLNGGVFGFTTGSNVLANNFSLGAGGSGFTSVNSIDYLGLTGTLSGTSVTFAGSGTTNVSGAIVGPGTANLAINVVGTGTTTVSGLIGNSGALGVVKGGAGTLVYTTAQTYTGSTSIQSGTLIIASGGGSLNAADLLAVNAGAFQLGDSGGAVNQTVTGLSGSAGSSIIGGNAATGTLSIINTSTGTYAGVIGGGGANQNNLSVLVTGTTGNMILGGANTFTGALIVASGSVTVNANTGLGAAGAGTTGVTIGNANTPTSGATVQLTNGATYTNNFTTGTASGTNPLTLLVDNNSTLSGLFNMSNNLTAVFYNGGSVSGTINLNNGGSLTLAPVNNPMTFSGTITGSGNLIINGTSTGNSDAVTFNQPSGGAGNGGWTGSLIINSGTVNAPGSNNPTNAAVTLVVNAGAQYGGPAGTANSSNVEAGFQDGTNGGGTIFLNRTATIAGNGSYTFGGNIMTNNAQTFTKEGAGTQTFSGSVSLVNIAGTGGYTMNITSGTLTLSNTNNPAISGTTGAASFSSGAINVSTGAIYSTAVLAGSPGTDVRITGSNATLKIAGNYVINEIGTVLTIKGGNGTSTGQGTLSLQDGQINTLVTISSNATPLVMGSTTAGAPSVLAMDVGSTSDQFQVGSTTGGGKATINNNTTAGVLVNINGLGGLNGTTQTLLLTANTGTFSIGAGNNFLLNTTTGNFNGYTVALSSTSAGKLYLTETLNSAAGIFYWTGTQGNGTWNVTSGGNTDNSNWSTTSDGLTDPHALPGSANDVSFSASNGSNFSTTLGQNFSIQGLIFSSTGSAVTIAGAANTLTLGVDGITVQAGAPTPTISTNVALGSNQTWTINSATTAPLTVTGTLSGNKNLTVTGTGEVILGGNNTFSGTVNISGSSIVQLGSATALGSAGSPNALVFGASSSGTLSLAGFSTNIGSLSSDPAAGSPVIRNGSGTAAILTGSQGTSGTYGGVIRDGSGSASLGFTKTGSGTLTLTGANTYTGSTIINAGGLNIRGSLGAGGVTVNSGGVLSGTGGTIGGAVTVNSGGEITAGTAAAPGTLTLSNGLSIGNGGIAAFDFLTDGSANDKLTITSGGLSLASGAILQVTSGITASGTYSLITYTGPDPSLAGVVEQNLTGGALSANYSFVASSGSLVLIIAPSDQAIPGITITTPASNSRVMSGVSVSISGSVTNTGTANALSGSLSNGGGDLAVSNLTPSVASVGPTSATAYSGTISSTGVTLGNRTFAITVTDGSASPTSATATGTLDVVQNRVVLTTASPSFGVLHVGASVSGTAGLVSAGSDNLNTRVTVANAGADANGISFAGSNASGTFNGSFSATGTLAGTFTTSGTKSGSITLVTTGEGLAGESPNNVTVNYTAQIFSGQASWAVNSNSSWSTNSNWGDTNINDIGGIGAPGVSGALSVGDTATFNDVPSQSGTLTVSLNGATPSLAGIAFNSTNGYIIAPGSGGSITLQSGASLSVAAATKDVISTTLLSSGNGGFTYNGNTTGDLILSGSIGISGSSSIASGTLTMAFPGTMGVNTSGTWNIASGATFELNTTTGQNLAPANGSITFTGNGTLLKSGTSGLQMHGSNGALGAINFAMTGGIIEVAAGEWENGGNGTSPGGGNAGLGGNSGSTNGSPTWTNNQASLQIDSGALFAPWDANGAGAVVVDVLLGSGTLTRDGYNNTQNSLITIGSGSGSGTFSGVITNIAGYNSILKEGTGLQVFTGNNSYSGSTSIIGGTLRSTSNNGLGWGGRVFNGTGGGPGVFVSGSATLDLAGNSPLTVDNVISLNNGILTNSSANLTTLDNGIAYLTLTANGAGYTSPGVGFTNNDATGSGATGVSGSNTAPGGTALYIQLTNAGSGYTVAPTVNITDGGAGAGATATATIASLSLTGSNNRIGGSNGDFQVNSVISGAGVFNKVGIDTVTLTAVNTNSGTTNIYQGKLRINGSNSGAGPVNVAPNANDTATLSGTGSIAGLVTTTTGTGLNVAHIAPAVNNSGNFGVAGTLTLNGGLTIGNGTNLDFDLGTSQDLLATGGTLSLGTNVVLNINQLAGFSIGNTYTLISGYSTLSGASSLSTWTATGQGAGEYGVFSGSGGVISVSFTTNASTLVITPTPGAPSYISLGSVLVGYTPSSTTVTGSNGGVAGSGTYALSTTGSVSVNPTSTTLASSGTTGLTVSATGTIGGPSGNNTVIGQVSATNSANASGSLAPVNVTTNVYEVFSGSTNSTINSGTSATLNLTTLANDDGAGGQRAGVTIGGWSTTNSNFVVTTDNGGVVGTASGGNNSATVDVGTVAVASNLLSGTYNYSGSVTGTAHYTDATLQSQGGGSLSNPQWTGVSISGTVNATASYGTTKQAFINSGSSFAGYGLTSTSGSNTTATLLNGTASADSTITMTFSAHGSLGGNETGSPSPYQSSDTLTLTGVNPVGGNGPDGGSTLTDPFVLQLSVATNPNVVGNVYYLGWYDPNFGGSGGWVNAIAGNSNANLPDDYGLTGAYFAGSYSEYLSANSYTLSTPLSSELGAYGYDSTNGQVWAVLNYDSDVEVIPEPGTYAMIFSGFGMLIGFRRLRRRRSSGK